MKNDNFMVSKPGEIYIRVPTITKEILMWLDNYEGDGTYSRGWYGIYFTREEDAVMFSLRWI